jgi:hypothetical protein
MAIASTNLTTSIITINPIFFGAPKVLGIITSKMYVSFDLIELYVITSTQVITK